MGCKAPRRRDSSEDTANKSGVLNPALDFAFSRSLCLHFLHGNRKWQCCITRKTLHNLLMAPTSTQNLCNSAKQQPDQGPGQPPPAGSGAAHGSPKSLGGCSAHQRRWEAPQRLQLLTTYSCALRHRESWSAEAQSAKLLGEASNLRRKHEVSMDIPLPIPNRSQLDKITCSQGL